MSPEHVNSPDTTRPSRVLCWCDAEDEPHPFSAHAKDAAAAGEQRFPCMPSLGENCGNCHRCTDAKGSS